jgi:DNA-binding CsgD family transcriptional regulator/tetratricopeptide (TPR) repeat protein
MRVAYTLGVESEAGMGFAGLYSLLRPLLAAGIPLPTPQRDALAAAFGQVSGAPPDRFLVGLAALTLFAGAATQRPLLVAVDDAQWLDVESAQVLAFVARRLQADRVAVLYAVREPVAVDDPLSGLPELRVTGLEENHARELVARSLTGSVDPQAVTQVIVESAGNPLALVEFGAELSADPLGVGPFPTDALPAGPRLEARFARQLRRLPSDTQGLLLVGAATAGDPSLIWLAAERLGWSPHAIAPAVDAGLVVTQPMFAFRHPLIRSAVYAAATAAKRRHVHAVLAEVTDPETDPDRRAWHLAAATAGPSESLAEELERCAVRAQRRGGLSTQAAFLERSAEMTPDPRRQAERRVAAAEAALVGGAPVRARALLALARPHLTSPLSQAQASRVEAELHAFKTEALIPGVLVSAASELTPLDARLSRDTFAEALQACLVSCQFTARVSTADVGQAALDAPPVATGSATMADLVIDGFGHRFAAGYTAAVPGLRALVAALCTDEAPSTGFMRWASLGNNAAAELWDPDGYRTMLERLERLQRARGELDALRVTLGGKSHCLMWAGEFDAAERAQSEANEISVALGGDPGVFDILKVELYGWQGRDDEARTVASPATFLALETFGAGIAVNLARIGLSVLCLGQSRYDEALVHAARLMEDDPSPQGTQSLPEVVEAAARSGKATVAEAALDRLTERALASATPWALGLLARSRALVAADAAAEELYLDAIAQLQQTYVVTDLARAHLLYGEWLRREKRRTDARAHLHTAHDLFATMGAAAFAERARIELAATGERARRRSVETRWELTPQERQIALVAADGATNGEIAASLFLSPNTVDYHLRKVYRKLSVSSRRELRQVLVP